MVVAAFAEKRTRENVHEHKNRAFSGDTGSYRGQMFGAELIATVYRKDREGGREGRGDSSPRLFPPRLALFTPASAPSFNCRYSGGKLPPTPREEFLFFFFPLFGRGTKGDEC